MFGGAKYTDPAKDNFENCQLYPDDQNLIIVKNVGKELKVVLSVCYKNIIDLDLLSTSVQNKYTISASNVLQLKYVKSP